MAIIFLIISLAISAVLFVIGLFVGNIILFDSIILSIAAGVAASHLLEIPTAFCLLIGIGLLLILLLLQKTKVGFWIIGILMSAVWAFVFGLFAHGFSHGNMVWFYTVFGLSMLAMIGLHLNAKNR